jgi:hypothetical protein
VNGVDFGFVGSAYDAPAYRQDTERLINWYVEVAQSDKAKTPTALLGAPGLNTVIDLFADHNFNGPMRGCWVLPGNQKAVVVMSNQLYLITMTVPASAINIPQFTSSLIGELLTNSGPVSIRDNGAGGYVVIVDGPNGYYYRMAGAGSTQITGSPVNGSSSVAYSGALNTAVVVGSVITGPGIPANTTITDVNGNLGTITLSQNATSSPGAVTLGITLAEYGRITAPGFMGADRVSFVDGWLIFNKPGTQTFYTTSPVPYTLQFDPTFFALKDSASDNLITQQELNREVWLIGERASEVWFNAGGAQFAFQRIPGVAPPIGCSAAQSLAQAGDSLIWLARTAEGQNIVVRTQQYSWMRVSDHGVEKALTSYPLTSDAVGYAYEEEGHLFYVLNLPTADKTWVLDLSTGKWHERLSYDKNTGLFHRHRSNCYMNFQNVRMVGDYQQAKIYQMSRKFFDDAGEPLIAIRRTAPVWSRENRQRIQMGSLQVEFAPGVGTDTGQGSDPQAMLSTSRDGGKTFGVQKFRSIGKRGETLNRCKWNKLAMARDTVFEVQFSDPTARDVVGATLYAAGTGNDA